MWWGEYIVRCGVCVWGGIYMTRRGRVAYIDIDDIGKDRRG